MDTKHVASTIVVEPQTDQWLEALAAAGGPPLYTLSPQDAREVLRGAQTSVEVDLQPADIEDLTIPDGPTGNVSVRLIRPMNRNGVTPAVVYSHGGGWVLGDKDTHDRLVRELANETGATIVFVDYTPAPEAQYPVQNEQAFTVLRWVDERGDDFGVDPSRIAVAGDSAGGHMSIALTLMAKERGGPNIVAQALFYPVTDASFDTGSYTTYSEGYFLTREAMKWFWDAYLPDVERRMEPAASPLQTPEEELIGLPPAIIINGEHDVLRDEGEAYARRLVRAGVPVTQVRYAGTIHDFMMLNPITNTPAARSAIAQASEYLRRALSS